MPFSPDIENVLTYLDQASGEGLRKRNDMGTLLELAAESGDDEAMNRVIFHGAHLRNIYRTLRKTSPGAEGYATLEREFSTAVSTLHDLLAHVLVDASPEQVERFETQYYAPTQGSIRNLVDLAHDLGVLKGVQNEQRYDRPAGEGEGGA
jgi:hypothetical protein